MKQNKLKTLALVLALALVLSLAVCMLVACNPKDDNTTGGNQNTPAEDGNNPSGLAKIFSEEQFNAIVGYVNSSENASSYIYYYTADAQNNGTMEHALPNNDIVTKSGMVAVKVATETKNVSLAFLSSPEEATAVKNYLEKNFEEFGKAQQYNFTTIGNIAIAESEKDLYKDQIAKATIPDSVSEARKQMLKQSYNILKTGDWYWGFGVLANFDEGNEYYTTFLFTPDPKNSNCEEMIGFWKDDAESLKQQKADFEENKKFYTDDSYFDITREDGYWFQYKKDKPGFLYGEVEHGENAGKFGILEYYYNEGITENLTVPSKIDGKDIVEVNLRNDYIKNLTVSEGITTLAVYDENILQSVKLPSTLKSLTIYADALKTVTLPANLQDVHLSCESLKTVNYDGNTADFEKKFGKNANGWCHFPDGYDETTHQTIYKDITITVVCKDGTLTYPKNNEQA